MQRADVDDRARLARSAGALAGITRRADNDAHRVAQKAMPAEAPAVRALAREVADIPSLVDDKYRLEIAWVSAALR